MTISVCDKITCGGLSYHSEMAGNYNLLSDVAKHCPPTFSISIIKSSTVLVTFIISIIVFYHLNLGS